MEAPTSDGEAASVAVKYEDEFKYTIPSGASGAKRQKGVPNYSGHENLAIALACIETSEFKKEQPGIDLAAPTPE